VKLIAVEDNCSGCRVCKMVCAMANYRETAPSKAALSIIGEFPAPGKYKIHLCDQCGDCAEACPTGAIHLEDGVYLVHKDECTGCMVCVDACAKGVMYQHKAMDTPIKCTLCGDCASICPREALVMVEN